MNSCLSCLNPEDGFDRDTVMAFQHRSAARTRENRSFLLLQLGIPAPTVPHIPPFTSGSQFATCTPEVLPSSSRMGRLALCPGKSAFLLDWEVGSMYLTKCVHFVLESA